MYSKIKNRSQSPFEVIYKKIFRRLLHIECVGVFEQDSPVVRKGTQGNTSEAVRIDAVIIDDVEVFPFSGIEAKSEIGHH
jgi:hypothetical protein